MPSPRSRLALSSPRGRVPIVLAAAVLLSACGGEGSSSEVGSGTGAAVEVASPADAGVPAGTTVTVHRSATCECCGEYEAYLAAAGFDVEQELHEDLVPVKAGFGVPDGEGSCHTSELAGYAAEGHIPVEALIELMASSPAVDGISLAGMPAGSPGMAGEQDGPFVVRTFEDGEVTGEFGRF